MRLSVRSSVVILLVSRWVGWVDLSDWVVVWDCDMVFFDDWWWMVCVVCFGCFWEDLRCWKVVGVVLVVD